MAYPALGRNSKGWQVEDAVNRILRWLNGLTTRGDLLVRNDKGDLTRLAVGTNGQVLTSDGTDPAWADIPYPVLTKLTNALVADVSLNNTANYFDGPSVTQGTTGTWLVTGTVTVKDSGATNFYAKLWDGTTVIASGATQNRDVGSPVTISLSGVIASPAGDLRISVRDVNGSTGVIAHDVTGLGNDSAITAIRIG